MHTLSRSIPAVSVMSSSKPLIAVCGTTGVGKSKLGVELALKLAQEANLNPPSKHGWRGARIINADSMQVYTGMDVITNKIPQSERMGVEHLLMDFKQPGEQYVVGQWVKDAIEAIEETHNLNQIPIVVGGTSYWIQHLLFPNRLVNKDLSSTSRETTTPACQVSASLEQAISQLTPNLSDLWMALPESPPNAATLPEEALILHRLLQALDGPVASRWHWRDTRKVLRNLQIMKETGRMPSEIIGEQSETALAPRYQTLCFWLYSEPSALNPRLNERVDDMIKCGLLDEIRSLQSTASSSQTAPASTPAHREQNEPNSLAVEPDYTFGVYQSIGFKEFHDFLSSPNGSQEAFARAVEAMKHSTRKYARRQVTWLRNKLLPAIRSSSTSSGGTVPVALMYILNATVLGDQWISGVLSPAESIMTSFLGGEGLPDPASLSPVAKAMLVDQDKPVDPSAVLQARRKLVCSVCTTDPGRPVMIDQQEWDVHRGTRLHRRLVAKANKAAERSPSRAQNRIAPEGSSGDESNNCSDELLHLPS